MNNHAQLHREYAEKLGRHGQSHLLRFWDELDPAERTQLLDDLEQVDLERCAPLIDTIVKRADPFHLPERLDPPATFPAEPGPNLAKRYQSARETGAAAIRAGRVAAFTVAGGQGTRLGFDGPKGLFKITPVRDAPLFQVFAENLLGIERRYGRRPRWYIMTSPANHDATRDFFQQNAFFGLSANDVMFFPQRQMPAFLKDGRIAMSEKHRVALGPDGHGGSLNALAQSGALDDMRRRGIEYISYFQVDNPLVRAIDPLFVGLHVETGSEMSSKAVAKAHDLERVGNFSLADGKLAVIEYSDLPEKLAVSKNPDGSRRFDAGSIAVHILSRAFVERLTAKGATVQLPWHRAVKKVPVIDDAGRLVQPAEPNVVKLEAFVFDAIPLAKNPLVLFTPRAEEFSPVKNADGPDSPATTRRDLLLRAARWLEACGCRVPRDAEGMPDLPLEISPAYALDAEDLGERLKKPVELQAGKATVWA
jgi:UDP-N-acetylglucosamine/UDP-N-acetylgalactosamine diphosphorylase